MLSRATSITRCLLVALVLIGMGGPAVVRAAVVSEPPLLAMHPTPDDTSHGLSNMATFDPAINMIGLLQAGSLGLPGEPVGWLITVTNRGSVVGTGFQVSDMLSGELRVDNADIARGIAEIEGQLVTFRLGELRPGETIEMRINTTVLQGPPNGVLINQATLTAPGPEGPVTRNAVAEVFVPTGLPATGYPRVTLPGDGEPPAWTVGLIAFGTVALTAVFVWRRGRRAA